MASIQLDQVCKYYQQTKIVNQLTLFIEDGEFLVLVGPSGCGKTTSLRMIAGLETITSGTITIGARVINDVAPKDRNIAMVFQSYALYPHLSVAENMAFGLRLRRLPRAEIQYRVSSVAKQLSIDHLLARYPKDLSGGQRQRVALGRAMVRQPVAFLMDEPLSNLDPGLRLQARTEIYRLHQQLGTTFIYVTHDQAEAMTLGTRIAVLREGHLQQVDPPVVIYNAPRNLFVANFMGNLAMNCFKAEVTYIENELHAQTSGFCLPLGKDNYQNDDKLPAGKSVILGIRPEHVYPLQFLSAELDLTPIRAQVTRTENLGYEVILYLQTLPAESPNEPFIARVDPRTCFKAGEVIQIGVDSQQAHLFDPETELRIPKTL